MENTSEAVIMAGQLLIFIVALTVCISSFTTLRVEVDRVMGQTETIQMAKGSNGYINYIKSRDDGSARVVGAETVVSSMYRAIKENYVIYIKLNDYNGLAGSTITTTKAKENSKIQVNGKPIIKKDDKIIRITIGIDNNQKVSEALENGFYEKIKNLSFNEYLGEYQNASATGVATENKKVYRIITYVQI